MAGSARSGLSEGLEVCCGPVSVTHMITGKAYAKALRGHLSTDSALSTLLIESVVHGKSEVESIHIDTFQENDKKELEKYYQSFSNQNCDVDEPLPEVVQMLDNRLRSYTAELANKSRIAKL